MDSALERFGEQRQFSSLGSMAVPSLIIAGYLTLASSALWAFSRRAEPTGVPARPETSSPALICHCSPDRTVGGDPRDIPDHRLVIQKL